MAEAVVHHDATDEGGRARLTQRQLSGLMASLVVVFILGVALTTVVNYQPGRHSVVQTSILVLHIVAAVGVLAQGITRLVFALRWNKLVAPSVAGLASILIALGAGAASTNSGNDWAVFIMALGFIAAFAAYGLSFLRI
jgi:hypothetical protein